MTRKRVYQFTQRDVPCSEHIVIVPRQEQAVDRKELNTLILPHCRTRRTTKTVERFTTDFSSLLDRGMPL